MSVSVVFENVSFAFHRSNTTEICRELSFALPPGRITGIVGPSGVGKTSLHLLMSGLLTPDSGQIRIRDLEPTDARRQGLVAYAPQRGALCSWLTAKENVVLAMRLAGAKTDLDAHAAHLLDAFGLSDAVYRYPDELSGGMQQRVVLAMALGTARAMVLLDEPFAALDSATRNRIYDHLLAEWEQQAVRASIILISHDINEAVYLSDQVLVLPKRPLTHLEPVPIALERPRRREMKYCPEFLETVRDVEEMLRNV